MLPTAHIHVFAKPQMRAGPSAGALHPCCVRSPWRFIQSHGLNYHLYTPNRQLISSLDFSSEL